MRIPALILRAYLANAASAESWGGTMVGAPAAAGGESLGTCDQLLWAGGIISNDARRLAAARGT